MAISEKEKDKKKELESEVRNVGTEQEPLGTEDELTRILTLARHLTPHQLWLTQGHGQERPFTGEYWYLELVGYYHCIVCDQRLFSFDHKIKEQISGFPSFWNSYKNVLRLQPISGNEYRSFVNLGGFDGNPSEFLGLESSKEEFRIEDQLERLKHGPKISRDPYKPLYQPKFSISCSGCQSHLGLVFPDGPPPTFSRFSVNSGALKFHERPWSEVPAFQINRWKEKLKTMKKPRFK